LEINIDNETGNGKGKMRQSGKGVGLWYESHEGDIRIEKTNRRQTIENRRRRTN
jgi:hypothetical protein